MPKFITNGSFVVGQSQTSAIMTNENSLLGLIITGSSISGSLVSFLVSNDGATYYPLYDYNNTEVTITVGSSVKAYNLNPDIFKPWDYIKVRLGTSASAKLQAGVDTPIQFVYG